MPDYIENETKQINIFNSVTQRINKYKGGACLATEPVPTQASVFLNGFLECKKYHGPVTLAN